MIKGLVYEWNRWFNLKIVKHYCYHKEHYIFYFNDNTAMRCRYLRGDWRDEKTEYLRVLSPKIQAKINDYLNIIL
jgi:hypothetical protein